MHKNADPIESMIEFAWSCGADRFWVNNAKDQLKQLQKNPLTTCVGWARINSRGDLFDMRQTKNPYINNLIPLFVRDTDVQQALSSLDNQQQ